jgi:hypothetical protein
MRRCADRKYKGRSLVLFIVGGRFREVHFQSRKLSDEEWDKIAELSGLPPDSRSELQDYVGLHRELRFDAQRKYGSFLWKKLLEARNKEQQSLKCLEAMISNPNFFPAIAIGLEDQIKIFDEELDVIRTWLKQCSEQKRKLVKWYDKAVTRLRHRHRGPTTSSLFNLVRLLNSLLKKHTGRRISRAKRRNGKRNDFDYVWEVCRIAEPDLEKDPNRGRKQVDEIVRRVATEDRANEDSFEIEGWGELIPDWRPANDISLENSELGITVEFHKEGDSAYGSITTSSRTPPEALPIIFLTPPFGPEN